MTPLLKYTLARLGIFVVLAGLLLLAPIDVSPLLKLMVAVLASTVLSFFLLRGMREQVGEQAVEIARRRTEKRERLRAALNGDDDGGESTPKAE
jgi:hypothetical protein